MSIDIIKSIIKVKKNIGEENMKQLIFSFPHKEENIKQLPNVFSSTLGRMYQPTT
jgi:hypothetical protein